ncbi:MAG: DUF5317 domain-containing protein [Anaerolineae bacterium]|jgi:hypothetical protein|nr:DUF5317 domain-containing protein [Anaerolineae bacterium]
MTLFILFLIIGLVIGLLTRGDLLKLGELKFKQPGLLILALLIRLPLQFSPEFSQAVGGAVGGLLQVIAFSAAIAFAIANRDQRGMFLIALGALFNILPIATNGGYMPGDRAMYAQLLIADGQLERAEWVDSADILLHTRRITPETHFWFLSDVIPVPRLIFTRPYMISPGDVCMALGIMVLVIATMHRRPTLRLSLEDIKA